MKVSINADVDPTDLGNALYDRGLWRSQSDFMIAAMKCLDSDAIKEIAGWAANELGMELKYK